MPNILTHTYITAEALGADNPDLLLGSTLPDFIGMYRDQVGGTLRNDDIGGRALQEGLLFHITTDDVFDHYTPLKSKLVGAAAADFAAHKVPSPRGVQLFCSDPGTEVLLDGVVQQDRNVSDMFLKLADDVLKDRTSLHLATADQGFADFVKRYFERGIPVAYKDPALVARLLQRRLADRFSRKGKPVPFTEEHVPVVAEVFNRQIGRLNEYGGVMLKQVIHSLKTRRVAKSSGLALPSLDGIRTSVGHISGLEAETLLNPDADEHLKSMRPSSIHGRVLLRELFSKSEMDGYVGSSNPNGLPLPERLLGSISHTKSGWVVAAAATTDEHVGIGVDIEQIAGRRDIVNRVCLPDELPEIQHRTIVTASAKEAAYKAFSSTVNHGLGRWVGFKELRLELADQTDNTLSLRAMPESELLAQELTGLGLRIDIKVAGGHVLAIASLK